MNGLSLFFAACIGFVAVAGLAAGRSDELDPRRFLTALAGLVVVSSSRDLLWIYLGFEVASLALSRPGIRTIAGTLASLVGLVVIVVSSGTTDLAAIESTTAVKIGVVLVLGGLLSKWLQSSTIDVYVFLGGGVAIVAVFVRLAGWFPDFSDELAPLTWLAAVVGIVVGSAGAAFCATTRTLVVWLTIAFVGLALAALPGGAPVLPHVLMHVGASTVALGILLSGRSTLAGWLTLLSLASFPPLPGFTTKLALLASLSPSTLVIALAGTFFVGVGCARALARLEPSESERVWVSAAAVATSVAFGLFPAPMFGVAARAAAGLF